MKKILNGLTREKQLIRNKQNVIDKVLEAIQKLEFDKSIPAIFSEDMREDMQGWAESLGLVFTPHDTDPTYATISLPE